MVAQSIAPNDSVLYQGYHDEGRDKFENIKENPNKITKEEPVSTFSVDVDTASYSFVRGELNRGELPQKDAVRVEEMINYFDYDYALPASKDEPFQPNVAVYPTPWNANTKIMQIGVKGYDIKSTEKPRANLTFLIDVSGSMNEPNKLPLLKQSMRMLVNELKSDDSVALVVYAGSAGTALEPTKVKNKQDILNAIDKLEAGGSTAGGEGINLAYKLAEQNFDKQGVNRVILATDGDFNVGITDPEELKSLIVKKRDTGVTLSVLGFGEGNYNDELMQKLAQNGNGNASYIDTVNEARKVLVNEAGSTLFTIAKDVKIQVEFNPSAVSEYRLIGYTTRILNREDFNNDKVDAGDIGAGHKVTALYEITPKGAKGSVDPLRYGAAPEEEAKPAATSNGEYAFLKIRYKLPTGTTSKLMTRAIMPSDDVKDAANVPSNLGFAAAVAAFGQKLAGDVHVGNFTYDDILTLAKSTRGEDDFGYRTEFMQLVRTAKSLAGETGGLDKPIE
jgi:Ca-activated chloride channel family protein